MKKMVVWLVLIGLFLHSGYAEKYGTAVTLGGQAKMSFRVLDDEGCPVGSATVRAAFYFDPKKQGMIIGETDTNGLCSIEGITHMDVSYQIQKDGYYRTDGRYVFGMVEPPVINNRWQPWDPTNTMVLKRIKNPVPMYVKKVETIIPVLDQPVGFDLEKGDWVAPYGTGSSSDFVFKFLFKTKPQTYKDDFRTQTILSFSNPKDGIQDVVVPVEQWGAQSALKLPYQAQSNDHLSVYEWQSNCVDGRSEIVPERGDYSFRVRTKVDDSGKIISALYGKIHGSIETGGYLQALPRLQFTYYLNPTSNDRNVEFDPAKNLFGDRDRFAP